VRETEPAFAGRNARRLLGLLAMFAIFALAAAYRVPGIPWGSGFDARFHRFHPDEVTCVNALPKGNAWLQNAGLRYARGILYQCSVLSRALQLPETLTLAKATRIARRYAVVCGLVGIIVIGLLARALGGGSAGGLIAAFLAATCGSHIVTSFWARGQIQNSLAFFTCILLAVYSRSQRTLPWLFAASLAAGVAVSIRWSVTLLPMLLLAALTRGRPLWNLLAVGGGVPLGVVAGTGLQWTPEQIAGFIDFYRLLFLGSDWDTSWLTTVGASAMTTFAGAGLVTSGWAIWGAGHQLSAARRRVAGWCQEGAGRAQLRASLGSPWVLFWAAMLVQFALVSGAQLFTERYVDLLAAALCVVAAVQLVSWARGTRARRGWIAAVIGASLCYQAVYAAGVLDRYTHDSRVAMDAALSRLLPDEAVLHASHYVPITRKLRRYDLVAPHQLRGRGYALVSDVHLARYRSRTPFLASGAPESCRRVFHCDGDAVLAFYQSLDRSQDFELIHTERASAWTPEMRLMTELMGSAWMFTGDTRLYRMRE
jgi:hypothetical protein